MPSMSMSPEVESLPVPAEPATVLDVRDLTVGFADGAKKVKQVVHGIDFQVPEAGSLAIVGESGSGKSVSMRGVLGLLPSNAQVGGSAVLAGGTADEMDLLSVDAAKLRGVLGRDIGMVFQNAMEALNPSMPIEKQLTEHLVWHGICSRSEARRRAVEALGEVGIPAPERRMRMYPFQLSGGMRQRVMIAMATITRPRLLIADEPTTALDVTVQKQILELLAGFRETGMGLVMITHDLGVARYLCDEAVVLREGELLERGQMSALIRNPQHSYSKSLVESSLEIGGGQVAGEVENDSEAAPEQEPLVRARKLTKLFKGRVDVLAVDQVSFDIDRGRTLAVVGESGSGKSTLARLTLRLIEATSGDISFDGVDLIALSPKELRRKRLAMQMVFQSPYGSLLPAATAAANIEEPLRINRIGTKAERRERAVELMELVQLSPQLVDVYPRQLSGGQQQRVAIARALALKPDLLIADEPTSALDASVQIQVLELMRRLQQELGFAMLVITHNLAVVEQIADQALVMRNGQVVESGHVEALFRDPQHEYTRQLLDAVLPVRSDLAAP
ncbi:MAG: dipeptide ABC transporter ATP-binding protein [Propionibacteriaceae bacterium]